MDPDPNWIQYLLVFSNLVDPDPYSEYGSEAYMVALISSLLSKACMWPTSEIKKFLIGTICFNMNPKLGTGPGPPAVKRTVLQHWLSCNLIRLFLRKSWLCRYPVLL